MKLQALSLAALLAATAATAETEVSDVPASLIPEAVDAMKEIAAEDPNVELTEDADGEVDGMVMLSDVLFDFAAADLMPEAEATLASIAAKLDGIATIEVVGHTDDVGSDAFNDALGLRRAETVRAWLTDGGYMAPEHVLAATAGEREPVATNDTDENRALNRRVAFKIMALEEVAAIDETPAGRYGPSKDGVVISASAHPTVR